jgi:hypothetical protein
MTNSILTLGYVCGYASRANAALLNRLECTPQYAPEVALAQQAGV